VASNVYFGLLTPAHIGSRSSGRIVLETLLEATPEWSPETYNYFEPVNRPFDPLKLDEALDAWRSNFLWRRKKPPIHGSAWFGGNIHSSIYIKIPRRTFDIESAMKLVRVLRKDFAIDLSYVHVTHDTDFDNRERYRAHVEPLIVGLTTHCLREGLPDVPWAMLFGPPYVDLFGRERLLTTPAAHVEETAGGVYVQLTASITDVATHRESYLAAQEAATAHLDCDAFRRTPPSASLRVPEFSCPQH
jgi:hypothetical protein